MGSLQAATEATAAGRTRLLVGLLALVGLLLIIPAPPAAAAARAELARGASIAVEDHATDFLLSPDGTFACGFYDVSPTVFAVAVWFARAADRAVVWTAAPARPFVHSTGARLALDGRRGGGGALVLTDYGGQVVWNSSAAGAGNAARARLLDTGNLVLEDAAGAVVWQSFDSPTDTLLPAQRFTAARHLVSRGGRGRLLAAGYYSLGFSDYAMLSLFYDNHNFSSIYWPNPYNNYVANGRRIYNFTREAALDARGRFLSSDAAGFEAADIGGGGVRRRLTLDADGNLRLYSLDAATGAWAVSWAAFGNPCTIHGVCGANAVCLYAPAPACVCAPGHERADPADWAMGCRPLFRRDGGGGGCARPTKLVALPQSDFWGYDLNGGDILPFAACAAMCQDNCACVAFQHKSNMECYLKSVLFNGRTFPGLPGTVYIKVPADFAVPDAHVRQWRRTSSEPGGAGLAFGEDIPRCDLSGGGGEVLLLNVSTGSGASEVGRAVWSYLYGFLSAVFVVEAIVIGFGCWLFSRRGLFRPSRVWAIEEGYKLITSNFQRYSYSEIRRATGNFTDVIGSGGSGVVYKGVLEDGRVVAVKVLKNVSQSEEEFQSELSVIGRIYHMNLVRVYGCCSEAKHRILVSEHIENGSLAEMLFDTVPSSSSSSSGKVVLLRWSQRFRIALGVAKGLAYLHNECAEWIIHCDMKPENILLDQELEPKITDFGLAKLLNRDGSDAGLSRIRGTRGYMAPEWVSSLPITEKVDVYSYGVVLLELMKGVRVSEWVVDGVKLAEMDTRMVVRAIRGKMEPTAGDRETCLVKDLVDHRLNGEFSVVQAKAMLKIAVSCLEEDRGKRPNMSAVVQALISVEDEPAK